MANYNDGENGIFVISKKFEEIQGEIFRNQSSEFSPITIARTNLAPEVSKKSFNARVYEYDISDINTDG